MAVLEGGEVGDERVEVVGALDQDEAARGSPGAGAVGDEAGEVGVGQDLAVGDQRGRVAEARVVEDRPTARSQERGCGAR